MANLQQLWDTAYAADIAPLNAQLAQLQADLAASQAQLAPLQAQIIDLQAQIAVAPVATGFNTGYRGPITTLTLASAISADNTVIENKNLTTTGFVVTGANVVFRNCLIAYTGAFGIDASVPVTIEGCSLRPTGAAAGPSFRGAGVFKTNKIDILPSGVGGIVLTGVSTVQNNYFSDVAAGANFTAISGNTAGSIITNNVSA